MTIAGTGYRPGTVFSAPVVSGDHTILNNGSAIGHDVFPFKTSISMLICLTSARSASP